MNLLAESGSLIKSFLKLQKLSVFEALPCFSWGCRAVTVAGQPDADKGRNTVFSNHVTYFLEGISFSSRTQPLYKVLNWDIIFVSIYLRKRKLLFIEMT
jgi:hypothetical protein